MDSSPSDYTMRSSTGISGLHRTAGTRDWLIAVLEGRWYVKQRGTIDNERGIPVLVWDLDAPDAPLVADGYVVEVDVAHIEQLVKSAKTG